MGWKIYNVPGAGSKLRDVAEIACPGSGAVWTIPRLAATYVAAGAAATITGAWLWAWEWARYAAGWAGAAARYVEPWEAHGPAHGPPHAPAHGAPQAPYGRGRTLALATAKANMTTTAMH